MPVFRYKAVDAAGDVATKKHPLPRHQYPVEDNDAIHFLEARTERCIEMRAAQVEAVAAEELEPWRIAVDREGESKRLG